MPTSTITGAGTFRLSGNSTINQSENGVNGTRLTFAMQAGGWIDLLDTSRLTNGGWQELNWTNNKASMNIASGATFDIWDGQAVIIDALTGSGTFDKVHGGNSPTSLTVGVANGSGTFSGTIKNTGGQIAFTKVGSGTQTFSGANTYTGSTTINGGTLRLGNGISPTNLADAADVIVATGAMLHLDYSGTDRNRRLCGSMASRCRPAIYSVHLRLHHRHRHAHRDQRPGIRRLRHLVRPRHTRPNGRACLRR